MWVAGVAVVAVLASIVGFSLVNRGESGGGIIASLVQKEPKLKDGKYCAVTGTYGNLAKTIVYNFYECVKVTNHKTYTQVVISYNPPALSFKDGWTKTLQFDLGEELILKNDDGEEIGTLEQIDDETILMTLDDEKTEFSSTIEEDTENQADK